MWLHFREDQPGRQAAAQDLTAGSFSPSTAKQQETFIDCMLAAVQMSGTPLSQLPVSPTYLKCSVAAIISLPVTEWVLRTGAAPLNSPLAVAALSCFVGIC
jgi:hypothetical protein